MSTVSFGVSTAFPTFPSFLCLHLPTPTALYSASQPLPFPSVSLRPSRRWSAFLSGVCLCFSVAVSSLQIALILKIPGHTFERRQPATLLQGRRRGLRTGAPRLDPALDGVREKVQGAVTGFPHPTSYLCPSPPPLHSQIYCIESAHGQLVRDLDFNPNKQYYLASCGDDCRVKFWDTRNVTEPVKTLEEHSHWCVPRGRLGEGLRQFILLITSPFGKAQTSLVCAAVNHSINPVLFFLKER